MEKLSERRSLNEGHGWWQRQNKAQCRHEHAAPNTLVIPFPGDPSQSRDDCHSFGYMPVFAGKRELLSSHDSIWTAVFKSCGRHLGVSSVCGSTANAVQWHMGSLPSFRRCRCYSQWEWQHCIGQARKTCQATLQGSILPVPALSPAGQCIAFPHQRPRLTSLIWPMVSKVHLGCQDGVLCSTPLTPHSHSFPLGTYGSPPAHVFPHGKWS